MLCFESRNIHSEIIYFRSTQNNFKIVLKIYFFSIFDILNQAYSYLYFPCLRKISKYYLVDFMRGARETHKTLNITKLTGLKVK